MKKIAFAAGLLLATFGAASGQSAEQEGWKLTWSDEFAGPTLDTSVWSRTTPDAPDWAKEQSADPSLVVFRDGSLVLRAIENPDTVAQPTRFICGGVLSKGKKEIAPGSRVEVKARLQGAKGAWPAIWLMPGKEAEDVWPLAGEIDVMERLNNNHFAYQTVHSNYTQNLGQKTNPLQSVKAPIDRDGWNVYGVEILPDEIVFMVDGKVTNRYPRLPEKEAEGQYPFWHPWYVLLDMQMEGAWVGEGDPGDLPVEMEIDYIRVYEK